MRLTAFQGKRIKTGFRQLCGTSTVGEKRDIRTDGAKVLEEDETKHISEDREAEEAFDKALDGDAAEGEHNDEMKAEDGVVRAAQRNST